MWTVTDAVMLALPCPSLTRALHFRKAAKARPASGRPGQGTSADAQAGATLRKGTELLSAPQHRKPPPQRTIDSLESPADVVALLLVQRFAQSAPQQGALFVVHMER